MTRLSVKAEKVVVKGEKYWMVLEIAGPVKEELLKEYLSSLPIAYMEGNAMVIITQADRMFYVCPDGCYEDSTFETLMRSFVEARDSLNSLGWSGIVDF